MLDIWINTCPHNEYRAKYPARYWISGEIPVHIPDTGQNIRLDTGYLVHITDIRPIISGRPDIRMVTCVLFIVTLLCFIREINESPRILDPFYIVTCQIKWVKTSWTYRKKCLHGVPLRTVRAVQSTAWRAPPPACGGGRGVRGGGAGGPCGRPRRRRRWRAAGRPADPPQLTRAGYRAADLQ